MEFPFYEEEYFGAATKKPTTAKATTAKATTAKATTAKATTAKATTAKATTAKATTAKATTLRATTAKATTAIPTTLRATTAIPTTIKATTAIPTTIRATTAIPTTMRATSSGNKRITVTFYTQFNGNGNLSIKSDMDQFAADIANIKQLNKITIRTTNDVKVIYTRDNRNAVFNLDYRRLKDLAKGGNTVDYDFKINPDGNFSFIARKNQLKTTTSTGKLYVQGQMAQLPMFSKQQIMLFVLIGIVLLGGLVYFFMKKKKNVSQAASITAFGKKLAKMVKV